jgi:nucleoredoxin
LQATLHQRPAAVRPSLYFPSTRISVNSTIFLEETHQLVLLVTFLPAKKTMMRLHALLLFFLVLTANAATQEDPAAATVIEDSVSQDEVASEQAAPIETADEIEVGEEVAIEGTDEESAETVDDANGGFTTGDEEALPEPPVQTGPLIDLFGPALLGLEMIDEQHAQLSANYTSDALRGKKVIGVYFSADWCSPCRSFTPELTSFYDKMNNRRGKKDEFEIIWVSRCRDMESFGQYFTQMGSWFALPPEEAMGARGQMLAEKLKVKGIPHLALLDDLGNIITLDGRGKIPTDKAGIGFPWRNPIATLYTTLLPRSLRMMLKSHLVSTKNKVVQSVKQVLGRSSKA